MCLQLGTSLHLTSPELARFSLPSETQTIETPAINIQPLAGNAFGPSYFSTNLTGLWPAPWVKWRSKVWNIAMFETPRFVSIMRWAHPWIQEFNGVHMGIASASSFYASHSLGIFSLMPLTTTIVALLNWFLADKSVDALQDLGNYLNTIAISLSYTWNCPIFYLQCWTWEHAPPHESRVSTYTKDPQIRISWAEYHLQVFPEKATISFKLIFTHQLKWG